MHLDDTSSQPAIRLSHIATTTNDSESVIVQGLGSSIGGDLINPVIQPRPGHHPKVPERNYPETQTLNKFEKMSEDALSASLGAGRNAWWRRAFPLQRGVLLYNISMMARVIFFTLISVLLNLLKTFGKTIPVYKPSGHIILGTALGLLLVYRTNASYDRFWEGRKLLCVATQSCLDLVRSVMVWEPKQNLIEFVNILMCFNLALFNRLRRHPERTEEYQLYLNETQLQYLADTNDDPYVLIGFAQEWIFKNCDVINNNTGRTSVTANYFSNLTSAEINLDRLIDTTIPISYVAHATHVVFLFLITLPFCILDDLGWFGVPIMFLVSFGLMGIDEAGAEIEEPFGKDANDLNLEMVFSRCNYVMKSMLAGGSFPVEKSGPTL